MNYRYHMPVTSFFGKGCIRSNYELFQGFGKRALIVTGRNSARINGSLEDVCAVLDKVSIAWEIFDRIEPNPSISNVREGAAAAEKFGADFVIGIGGGSPLDGAKAIAYLSLNQVNDRELFSPKPGASALPIIAVPTTAGTGSEATPYCILTCTEEKTKKNLGSEALFPRFVFMDPSYMTGLSHGITVDTALDALSHAMEGYLSVRSDDMSSFFALKSISIIGECFPFLQKKCGGEGIEFSVREKLLHASFLAGIVIAQTGTTVVHAMGYPLTVFKNIPHGRANGYLLPGYLRFVSDQNQIKVDTLLKTLGLTNHDQFKEMVRELVGSPEPFEKSEMERYAQSAAMATSTGNTVPVPGVEDIIEIYQSSMA